MKTIPKKLINKAEDLSAEWNNSGFIALSKSNKLYATVWNKWKLDDDKDRDDIVASVNGIQGWKISKDYKDKYKLPKEIKDEIDETNGIGISHSVRKSVPRKIKMKMRKTKKEELDETNGVAISHSVKRSIPNRTKDKNHIIIKNQINEEKIRKYVKNILKEYFYGNDDDFGIDNDYFKAGSESPFKLKDEFKPEIKKIIDTFVKEGIYVFKNNDEKLSELKQYLDLNNINYSETSQLGSDITVYDPEKHPEFDRTNLNENRLSKFVKMLPSNFPELIKNYSKENNIGIDSAYYQLIGTYEKKFENETGEDFNLSINEVDELPEYLDKKYGEGTIEF